MARSRLPFLAGALALASLLACSGPDGTNAQPKEEKSRAQKREYPEEKFITHRQGFVPGEEAVTGVWAYGMKCSPEEVGARDILRVTFLVRHGGEAYIISPSGEWYAYAFSPDPAGSIQRLRDRESMRQTGVFDVNLAKAVGVTGMSNRLVPIFVERGTYRLIVGSDLDIDIEDIIPDAYCHFIVGTG